MQILLMAFGRRRSSIDAQRILTAFGRRRSSINAQRILTASTSERSAQGRMEERDHTNTSSLSLRQSSSEEEEEVDITSHNKHLRNLLINTFNTHPRRRRRGITHNFHHRATDWEIIRRIVVLRRARVDWWKIIRRMIIRLMRMETRVGIMLLGCCTEG